MTAASGPRPKPADSQPPDHATIKDMDLGRQRIQCDRVLRTFVDDLGFGGFEEKAIRYFRNVDKNSAGKESR